MCTALFVLSSADTHPHGFHMSTGNTAVMNAELRTFLQHTGFSFWITDHVIT